MENKYGINNEEVETRRKVYQEALNAESIDLLESVKLFEENTEDNFTALALELHDKDGEIMMANAIYQDPARCCLCGKKLDYDRLNCHPIIPRSANHHDKLGYNCCGECERIAKHARIALANGSSIMYWITKDKPEYVRACTAVTQKAATGYLGL